MTKHQKKTLDQLWQKKITGGQCSYTGCNQIGCEGHHILKRRYRNTRWDTENGRPLCRGHHDWAERNPQAYEDLIIQEIGAEAYEALRRKARIVIKHFYEEIKEGLISES